MINKTFSGGLTSAGANATIDYTLNERVASGKAYILEGNVALTKQIISDCNNKWKWSSGVLSFTETMKKETLYEIIDEWKKTFLCGMEDHQTAPLFVVHEDKKRTEIHYIIPRLELTTGKAFNPYFVKRDFKKKDLFQQYINLKYNLSSPSYPSRTQEIKKKKKWEKDKKTVISQIDNYVYSSIKKGSISSRDGILEVLRSMGLKLAANVKTAKHIAIISPTDSSKTWRLKGSIYTHEHFSNTTEEAKREAIKEYEKRDITAVKHELDAIIAKNTKYNNERYSNGNTHAEDNPRERETELISRESLRSLTNQTNEAIIKYRGAEWKAPHPERVDTKVIAKRRRIRKLEGHLREAVPRLTELISNFKLENNRSYNEAIERIVEIINKQKRIEEVEPIITIRPSSEMLPDKNQDNSNIRVL